MAPADRRFLAFAIDFLFLTILQNFGAYLGGLIATVILEMRHAPTFIVSEGVGNGMILGWVFWGIAGVFLNYGVLQGLAAGSLGKLSMGLQVVGMTGKRIGIFSSLLRTFSYLVSLIPVGWGFLGVFRQGDTRCWHDRVMGTVVISRKSKTSYLSLPGAVQAYASIPEGDRQKTA